MPLSNDLVSEFAKVIKSEEPQTKTETVYGTIKIDGNRKYVQLDGSNYSIPLTATTYVQNGDRVTVQIKNHTAVVTGNLSHPSVNMETVLPNDTSSNSGTTKISQLGIVLAEKVNAKEIEADLGYINTLYADILNVKDVMVDGEIVAKSAVIEKLQATDAEFEKVKTDVLQAEVVEVNGELKAESAVINQLKATDAEFEKVKTDILQVKDVEVDGELTAKSAVIEKLQTEKLDVTWANIDAANIDVARIGELFAQSGIIKDIITESGTITGELVGVTIKGDLIEGNTIVADKLVVKGEDGLYYKLNTLGVTDDTYEPEYYITGQEFHDDPHGVLTDFATSDTMTPVYAYSSESNNSGYYTKVEPTSIYVDTGNVIELPEEVELKDCGTTNEGNIVYYYIDANNKWVTICKSGEDPNNGYTPIYTLVHEELIDVYYDVEVVPNSVKVEQTDYNSLNGSVITAKSITATQINVSDLVAFDATVGGFRLTESSIHSIGKDDVDSPIDGVYMDNEGQLAVGNALSYLIFHKVPLYYKVVYDENTGIYSDTDEEIPFIEGSLNDEYTVGGNPVYWATDDHGDDIFYCIIDRYLLEISADSVLFGKKDRLKDLSDRVKIGTYEDEPSIELDDDDTENKQILTSTRNVFYDETGKRTEVGKDGITTDKVTVRDTLKHGYCEWSFRSNGNYGLSWKEVVE